MTIPAGSSSTVIVVNPIADNIAEPVETVALTLQPPPPDIFPPPYLLSARPTFRAAGVSIRDQLLPTDSLSGRQRLVWLWRQRHVIVPLPTAVGLISGSIPCSNAKNRRMTTKSLRASGAKRGKIRSLRTYK